jgi:hypothetical protein
MSLFTGIGVWNAWHGPAQRLIWLVFAVLSFCILYLAIMLRQHYALGNQDRIVRLEFRLRYFELFGKNSKAIEEKLCFSQLAALRFAGDKEFSELLQRAMDENISGNEIKKIIQNWQADNMRV